VDPFSVEAVRAAYDMVAVDYAAAFAADLERLPVDRAILDDAARMLAGRGPVLDLGCGPGQVTRYLVARGLDMIGLDLAPGMLAVANRAHDAPLVAADMRSLPVRAGSCAGAVAFYSIQHVARASLPAVLVEIRRALAPAGTLVVATHLGEGEFFGQEFLGHQIDTVGGTFYPREELEAVLAEAAFRIEVSRQRGPLPHEHASERIYLIARSV
jgi:SAM-dependent methyltransferase